MCPNPSHPVEVEQRRGNTGHKVVSFVLETEKRNRLRMSRKWVMSWVVHTFWKKLVMSKTLRDRGLKGVVREEWR